MQTVLVIDDEAGIRTALKDILEDEKYSVLTAEDGVFGLDLLEKNDIDLVFLDIWLPRMGGIDVLKAIKEKYADTEVIIISGHATIDMAVQSLKLGAFDFIEKPLSIDRILTATRNALTINDLKKENKKLKKSVGGLQKEEMIGKTPVFLRVCELINQSAGTDARVLITGDNGTGKELVARALHRQSQRANCPFREVNCAAIPDTLIESELFGHEKGAFTDAVAKRKGKFEMADGGTLFLDEIADMSFHAQAKVLRAIQELSFERVGGESAVKVDVRIIAATNKNIPLEIKAGRFREDLYFRLNVIPIKVPSLAERSDDIPLLAEYFLKEAKGANDLDKILSPDAIELLKSYEWPGNIRELKNVMERISVLGDGILINAEAVKTFLMRKTDQAQAFNPNSEIEQAISTIKLQEARDQFEKKFILERLKQSGNNITKTSELLGIYPSNLHAKLKKFGIQVEK